MERIPHRFSISLGDDHTISVDRGLFLEQTWRLHPEICAFNSELFYDDKLHAKDSCAQQRIISDGPISGSGLRYLPLLHNGNKSFSIEEAEATEQLVNEILAGTPSWINRDGEEEPPHLRRHRHHHAVQCASV